MNTKGRVVRGWLGVAVGNFAKETATSLNTDGILVVEVFANSPAAAAGMKAGDLIVGAGNKTFNNSRELLLFVASFGVDKNLPVAIIREGQPLVLDVLIREKIGKTSLLAPFDKKIPETAELIALEPSLKKNKQERDKFKNR